MMKAPLALAAGWITLLAMGGVVPAHAAEAISYRPQGCDFGISFPEAPKIETRCDPGATPDAPKVCHEIASYTHVVSFDSSVAVRVACNPATKSDFSYSGDIMKYTLQALLRDESGWKLETSDLTYVEEDGIRKTSLLGYIDDPRRPRLVVGHLWLGQHSLYTVRAELIGAQSDAADTIFRNILASMTYSAPKE